MLHSILERRIATTISIFVLITALIVGAVIVPTVNQIKQIDADTYKLRETLERKNEQVITYRLAIKQMKKLQETMPPFNNYLFFSGDELRLITTLEGLASKNGVTQNIVNSSLDNITNQRVNISLNITGSYSNTLTYLDDLEHLPFFLNIRHLSVSPNNSRSPSDQQNVVIKNPTSMNLDLSLYVVP